MLLAWFLALSASGQPGHAQERVAFSVLEGAGAGNGIDEVCCNPKVFAPGPPTEALRIGYGTPAFWLKLHRAPGGGLIQFTPILDRVTLYARSKDGGRWAVSRTGDLLANDLKPVATPFMALPLPDDPDGDAVYALVEQGAAISLSVRHWTASAFALMQDRDRTIMSFLLGAICAIALYNLVVSLLVRDAVFAFNGLSTLSLCVCSLYLSGYGAAYFWPRLPWASNWIFILAILSCLVFSACFMVLFLKTGERSWRGEWPILAAPAAAVLALAAGLAADAPYWTIVPAELALAAVFLAVTLGVTLRRAFGGDAKARILLAPLVGAIIPGMALSALDKLAGFKLPGFGSNTLEITLAAEAMLFSLALARRVRLAEETARKNAAALLQARSRSAAQILLAQDRERKRLAAELHDNLGQELTLAAAAARRMSTREHAGDSDEDRHDLARRIAAALQKLRRISHEMHPATVEHLGLAASIEDAAERFAESSGIAFGCKFHFAEADLVPDARLHLLRIVQECLSNIVRHSGASACSIELRRAGDQLVLQVEDDGNGMPPQGRGDGLGMTSIDERVRTLAGTWSTGNSASGGACVRVAIPLAPPAPARNRSEDDTR